MMGFSHPLKKAHVYNRGEFMKFVRILPCFITALISLQLFTTTVEAATQPVCYNISSYSTQTLKSVQSALGVYVDGSFGPRSCEALIAFQQTHQPPLMDSSGNFGRLGPKTLAALGVSASSTLQGFDPARVPADSGTGRRIVVDQSHNWVFLISNGSVVASGGMVDNPSKLPTGTYWVGYKLASGIDDHSETLWLPNYTQFSGDIGFHKIPVSKSSDSPIHDESFLGTNNKKSGGCIRLGSEFSDRLFGFAKVGTKVVVIA